MHHISFNWIIQHSAFALQGEPLYKITFFAAAFNIPLTPDLNHILYSLLLALLAGWFGDGNQSAHHFHHLLNGLKSSTDIHGIQIMNPNDFDVPWLVV